MNSLILASSSPRRRELLTQVGIPFKVIPSDAEENIDALEGNPWEKTETLALHKASDVAKKLNDGLILGADTIVVLDGDIFGKPNSYQQAYDMLERMSGRTHQVITGIALVEAGCRNYKVSHEITEVTFKQLSRDRIISYLDTGEYEGKAGAYAIQGLAALFIKSINGCYSNVVGLPLSRLDNMLGEFGFRVL